MIIFILDKKDEFHFSCRFDELLIDVQERNERIEFSFGEVDDVKSNIQPQ